MDAVHQVSAEAVVSSFIHNNRHPEQNPLVPAVGIAMLEGCVMSAMYDGKLDILLTSSKVRWLETDERHLVKTGVVFLWLLLHHQLFLRNLEGNSSKMRQSGLLKIFHDAHALQAYEQLDSNNVHEWPPRDWLKRQPIQVPEIHFGEPPAKKSKNS